jgi:hypothetical protein
MGVQRTRGTRRFFYVSGPLCKVAHIMFGTTHSEGLTACGRIVSKGWGWSRKKSRHERVCKQCENAA